MFNKLKTVLKKNQQQPLQLSEEDRKKVLDKELLELTDLRIEDDKIPAIKAKIQSLLAKGANINARGSKDTTVLHNAVHKDKPALVEFFIFQGSEINAKNIYGQTPLYDVKSKAVTQQLLNANADIWVIDNDKCLPLEGSLNKQIRALAAKRALPKVIFGDPQIYHEANETLAKAYLKKDPNFKRPNCSEEIISKNDWEVWKEESLKNCDALAAPLKSLPSTSKVTPTYNLINEAMDLLEKDTQHSQFQREVDNQIEDSHLLTSLFNQRQTDKEDENKLSTKSKETLKFN